MTSDELSIKARLMACRPEDRAGAEDPALREAFEAVDRDPGLREWWEAEAAFDRTFAAKLAQVPAPADLKDRILAARKVVPGPAAWWRRPGRLFAAAAAVVIGLGVWLVRLEPAPMTWHAYVREAVDAYHTQVELDRVSPRLDDLRTWLAANGGAPEVRLPSGVEAATPLGCTRLTVAGREVSLICFDLGNGHLAHVFILPKSDLANPPPDGRPVFGREEAYSTAGWSDGGQVYLLAVDQRSGRTAEQFF